MAGKVTKKTRTKLTQSGLVAELSRETSNTERRRVGRGVINGFDFLP